MIILNAIKKILLGFWGIFKYPIIIIGLGVLVGIITHDGLMGFFTIGLIIVLWALWGILKD